MITQDEYDRIKNELKTYKNMVDVMSVALTNIKNGSDETAKKHAQEVLGECVKIKILG